MAQLVEQLIRNQQVAGSSPASSSIKIRESEMAPVFFWRSAEFRPGRRSPRTRSADMIVLSIALDLATIAVPSHLRLVKRSSHFSAPLASGHSLQKTTTALGHLLFWRSAESRPERRSPWTRSADMIILSIALDLATIAVPSHLRLARSRSLRCAPYESGQ